MKKRTTKIATWLLMFVLSLAMMPIGVTAFAAEGEENTIYFDNSSTEWDIVCVFYKDAEGMIYNLGNIPANEEGLYEVSIPIEGTEVTFWNYLLGTPEEYAPDEGFIRTRWFNIENNKVYKANTRVWVGGVLINDNNASDVLGDGTASYDMETDTLTLKNINITTGYEYKENHIAGIYADGDINIVLEGTQNKIVAPNAEETSYGIRIKGNLFISGSGNLNVSAGTVTAQDTDADSVGIFTNGQISINEVSVYVSGGSATANGEGDAYSSGICTKGGIDIDFGGSLCAEGGEAFGKGAYSSGIEGYGSDENYINIAVYDGYLEANGGETLGVIFAGSSGIYVENGGLYVYEKDAQVIITGDKAEASSTDDTEEPYAYSNGIYVYAGDVGIDAGNITVSSEEYTALNGDGHAIYVESEEDIDDNGEVVGYSGGYVDISCDEVVANKYMPGLIGTKVNITAKNGYAICAEEGINIDDTLRISNPTGGKVEKMEYEGGITYWAIANEEATVEPLGYKVSIKGLNYGRAVIVPANKSVNDTYCQMYDVDDFSTILDTDKEGYTFVGWYTDEACTEGKEFSFDDAITADISIYPKWVENKNSIENEKNISNAPDTGDIGNRTLWLVLLLISGGVVVPLSIANRKKVK